MKNGHFKNCKTVAQKLSTAFLLIALLGAMGCDDKIGDKHDGNHANDAQNANVFKTYRDVPDITQEEIDAVSALRARNTPLRLAAFRSTELFEKPDGTLGGFTARFGEWLSGFLGAEFALEIQGLNAMLENLQNGTLDFVVMSEVSERGQNHFTTDPVAQRMLVMLRAKESEPLDVIRKNRLPRYVFLENTIMHETVANKLPENSFEIIIAENEDAVYHALVNGDADAFITTNNMEAMFDHKDGLVRTEDFLPLVFFPAVLITENPELEPVISIINKALVSGAYNHLTELYRDGYGDYKRNRFLSNLTNEELEYIKENPTIPFATHYMAYPISFFNKNDGEWEGIVFDIMDELRRLTGLDFKHIHETEMLEPPELMELLKNGSAYFMPYLVYSEERGDRFLWAQTYFHRDRFALLSKQCCPNLGINDIMFQRIGLPRGTAFTDMFRQWFPNALYAIEYPSTDAAIDALERGEINYIMTSQSRLTGLTNYYELSNYKANFLFNAAFDIAPAFNLNHGHLRSIIDKATPFIDTERIAEQWMSKTYNFEHIRFRQMRRMFISVVSWGLVFIALVAFMLYKNNKAKMIRNAMRESEERLRAMLDNTPLSCCLLDKNFRCIDVNEEAVRLFGLKDKQEYLEMFYAGRLTNDTSTDYIMHAFEEGYWRGEKTYIGQPNNEPLPCELTLIRLKYKNEYAVAVYARDLREEKKIRHAELLQAINSTASVLLSVDGYEKFEERLASGLKILGSCVNADCVEIWKTEFIDGAPYAVLKYSWYNELMMKIKADINADSASQFAYADSPNWFERLSGGEIISGTLETLSKADADFVCLYGVRAMLAIPIIIQNDFWGLCCVDSIQKQYTYSEDEIDIIRSGILMVVSAINRHAQAEEIMEAMHKANEASRAKTNFLATMSHEIRTPMNAILGMSELALRKDNLSEIRDDVKMIRNAGSNLLAIINDVLDFSKIESGKMEIVIEDYSVASLINDVTSIVKVKLAESKVRFDVDIDETIPGILAGDVVRIRQSLLNILNNAVKFTKEGSISFKIRSSRVSGDTVVLKMSIADTGRGIKEKDLAKLFNEFVQIDATLNKGIEGTGLGLAITKRLVRAMGGDVMVHSVYGKGSEFTITLPQKVRSQKPLALTALESGDDSAEDTVSFAAPNARVLVVDDVAVNLKVATGLLEPYGMRVDTCLSGADAVDAVGANRYDLIFMDHMMPGMDGVSATKIIRELGVNGSATVPIVALTANAVSGMREMFLSNGFNDFLSKPIDTFKLNSILKAWIPAELQTAVERGEKAKSTSASANIVIDGVDVSLGMRRTGGKTDGYVQTLEVFYEEGLKTIDAIKKSLDNSDLTLYITRVHGLKSAAANIGATGLSDSAKELEMAARQNDREFVSANTPKLVDEFETLLTNVGETLAAIKKNGIPRAVMDPVALKSVLAKLKAAIDEVDPNAISSAVTELKAFEGMPEFCGSVSDILRNIINGSFDENTGWVGEILAKIPK